MNVRLFCLFILCMWWPLRRADPPFRGILAVVYVCWWSRNLNNDAFYTRVGLLRHREEPNFVVVFPTELRDFCILQKIANRLRGPPRLIISGYRGLFAHGLWCKPDYSTVPIAEFKNEWSYTSTSSYAVMVWTGRALLTGSNSPVG